MKSKTLSVTLAVMASVVSIHASAAAETSPDIQVHPSDNGGYVLTLTSPAVTNVPAAQAAMVAAAQKACAGKFPQFGHYKFKATAPMGPSGGGDGTRAGLVIDQEVACTDSPAQAVQAAPANPNWRPSDADYDAVIDTVTRFFAAKDRGDTTASYALMDNGMGLSPKEWQDTIAESTTQTGAVIAHRVVKLTWYKDPQNAPAPGVYAAADFVDRYEKATDCGYLSMHQKPDGSFLVIHEQDGFIPNQSNMTADQLAGYKAKLGCVADEPAPLPETKGDAVGYPDVDTARKALLARKDAQSHTEGNGWLVVYVPSELTLWSFSPPSDPSYPAVVKRVITQSADKNTYINMSVLCQASKQACDELVRQFNQLNEQIKASLTQH